MEDEGLIDREVKFTGSQINYYFICKRKLWLFSHNIELEQESDLVKLGALLHQNSYKRRMKEVQIDRIKVDFMENKKLAQASVIEETQQEGDREAIPPAFHNAAQEKELIIHEVKRSKKMQNAHLFQLLYYMYYLKTNYGVNSTHGVLHYPLLNQNVDVNLTQDKIKEIEEALIGMKEVNSLPRPPEAQWKRFCRSCAYADLCWG